MNFFATTSTGASTRPTQMESTKKRNYSTGISRLRSAGRLKFIPTGKHQMEPWDALYYTFAFIEYAREEKGLMN